MTNSSNALPPIEQIAAAAVNTLSAPTPESLISDIELAINLVKQFRADTKGLHPSVLSIIKMLI